jgi:desulfoferrodoxin (superoxide reductase-like protein)
VLREVPETRERLEQERERVWRDEEEQMGEKEEKTEMGVQVRARALSRCNFHPIWNLPRRKQREEKADLRQ